MDAQPFLLEGNSDTALLFIHGFTATPSEIYPTATLVHRLAGCTVSGILLPGHGSTPEQLDRTSWRDWVAAVEDECRRLTTHYRNVFLAGLSMGGLLSLHMAARNQVQGVISINAPVFSRNPFASLWVMSALTPLLTVVKPTLPKNDPVTREKLEKMGRQAYPCYPVRASRNMMLLRRLALRELGMVQIPALVMQGLQDQTVNAASGPYLQKQLKRAPVTYLELPNSDHVATMGEDKKTIAAAICEFMRTNHVQGGTNDE